MEPSEICEACMKMLIAHHLSYVVKAIKKGQSKSQRYDDYCQGGKVKQNLMYKVSKLKRWVKLRF